MSITRIFFFLCCPFLLLAQEEMTLEKAIAIGLENNYGIKISDTNIAIAENNDSWAVAGSGITLDLNGSFTNNLINNQNPASFVQGTFYSGALGAALDANWVVLNGGRIGVTKEILEKAVDQQKLNKLVDIQDLLREIYQNYYEVIFQQAQGEVLMNVLATSRDRLAYEQTKKEFGSSNSFNLLNNSLWLLPNVSIRSLTSLIGTVKWIILRSLLKNSSGESLKHLFLSLAICTSPKFEPKIQISLLNVLCGFKGVTF